MDIKSMEVYTAGMKKSLLDKIFFMDKINSSTYVDFGCADGEVLAFLKMLFPEYSYCGYDTSKQMLDIAKRNHKGILFTDNWDTSMLFTKQRNSTLILSSVIHEIYSYESQSGINEFYKKVFKSGFNYIVIRDMMLSRESDRKSDINDVAKIYSTHAFLGDKVRLDDFEKKWGNLRNNKNLLHYLLKYRYWQNWEREVEENYIPITMEHFLSLIPIDYEVIFFEHYCLPFLKQTAMADFCINVTDNTHVKFILKRRT